MKRGKKEKTRKYEKPQAAVDPAQQPSTDNEIGSQGRGHQRAMSQPKFIERLSDSTTGAWTVAITAIIAVIYFMQLSAMRDTVEVTRRSAERQDRAWVAVKPKGPFNVVTGAPVGIPFSLINFGKTPARHIHTDLWAKFIPVTSLEEMSETGPRMEMETGDLFPGNVNELEDFSTMQAQRQRPKGGHETENWPIESGEVSDFGAGNIYQVTYMVVSYDDIFGIHHWTRFCVFNTRTGAAPNTSACVSYNREDDNEEP